MSIQDGLEQAEGEGTSFVHEQYGGSKEIS